MGSIACAPTLGSKAVHPSRVQKVRIRTISIKHITYDVIIRDHMGTETIIYLIWRSVPLETIPTFPVGSRQHAIDMLYKTGIVSCLCGVSHLKIQRCVLVYNNMFKCTVIGLCLLPESGTSGKGLY